MIGRVKTVNSRGFGFIENEEGIDFFFHYTDYDGNWKRLVKKYVDGEIVSVEFENDKTATEGPKACQVKLVDSHGGTSG